MVASTNKGAVQTGFSKPVQRRAGQIRDQWSERERQLRKLQAFARQLHLARFAGEFQ